MSKIWTSKQIQKLWRTHRTATILGTVFVLLTMAFLALYFVPQKAYVDIHDESFEPETISAAAGTTVVFVNRGHNPHWPASNSHPTHTLYPESGGCIGSKFDACEPLQPEESFSFKLNAVGSWPIHDHIYPEMTGVIRVTSDSVFVDRLRNIVNFITQKKPSTQLSLDLPAADKFRSLDYATQIAQIKQLASVDPSFGWNYLKQAFYVNGAVVGNAHEMAHIIGNGLYKKLGLSGIEKCDAEFAYGCYHGVTEQLLRDRGPDGLVAAEQECVKIYPPDKSQNYVGCIHGFGHGLYTWFGLDVGKALSACDKLEIPHRNFCYDGVFMENSFDNPTTLYSASNPWGFCLKFAAQYQYNCARYQADIFMSALSGDTMKVSAACAQTTNTTLSTPCFENLGFHAAQMNLGNKSNIIAECGKFTAKDATNHCIIGAAREVIFQEYPGWNQTSKDLCATLVASWNQACVQSINEVSRTYQRNI